MASEPLIHQSETEVRICKHCGCEITSNAGRFPRRGPWLDSVDWSVCDWTYTNHEPKDGA